MDINKLEKICNEIRTDEVVLTRERLEHIKERHQEDFDLYFQQLQQIIDNPDYILKDAKNDLTAMLIKHIEDTNINVIIRLSIKNDRIHTKNSIMTLYRIRDKNLKKLMKRNETIYKRE